MNPILETDRLRLRPLVADDAPVIEGLLSDPRLAATTLGIPHPFPENGGSAWIERMVHFPGTTRNFPMAVVVKDSPVLMGVAGIHLSHSQKGELGYWVGVPYWGKGYTTEAVKRLIQFGFEDLGLNRIFASHFANNPASGRVMAKAGMTYEGTMRQHIQKQDVLLDLIFYSVLQSEYERAS
jgi:RimJ/RimL family protein N-acetyltransferase